jgi:hypothetical protein
MADKTPTEETPTEETPADNIESAIATYEGAVKQVTEAKATVKSYEDAMRGLVAFPGLLTDEQRKRIEAALPAKRTRKPKES